jgi:BioD-like phosphotransacetylase family protein
MNRETPRLFVAATEQNTGKTTTSLGLYAALRKDFQRIGFIKPVGQRFVEVEGKQIDEDSVLIRDTFGTEVPIEDMSPIAVEPQFTRRYINHANNDTLVRRIQRSFDRAAWEKDFAIIEGTGHAGVGSVFDLSNARVAKILETKVLLITPAGIGRPIDEAALNKALFDQEDVEVIGVVMNKVLPDRMESIADIARRGFGRLGLELLGMIPRERMLAQPTLDQICEKIRGEFLHGEDRGRKRIDKAIIGAVSFRNVLRDIEPDSLLIIPGDREDAIRAVIERSMADDGGPFCGMILSDDYEPSDTVRALLQHSSLPVILSGQDSYIIASRIHSMTVKTLPGDQEKISRITELVQQHVNIPRILENRGRNRG